MFIENNLSEDDLTRAHALATLHTPAILAGSYLSTLEAIDLFTQESVHKITPAMSLTERQQVVVGLYYRAIGFCRSSMKLNSVVDQQSLTSAERSCIEIYVDLALLHRNAVEKGVEKFVAFTDWQRLRAARRADSFFAKNPQLDTTPSKAEAHRGLINRRAQQIETTVSELWGQVEPGKRRRLEHWSTRGLPQRAELLDKEFELLVVEGYDIRNFAVHSGLAGMLNLEKSAFEGLCVMSLQTIGICLFGILRILGKEIAIHNQIPAYDAILDTLEGVHAYAFADKLLRSQGEPQRYFLHSGIPGPELIAIKDLEQL